MPKIELINITKRWGNFYGVDNLTMTIDDNSFVTLLGPSGCGKTTTLRMIAGLETPTSGKILIDGEAVFDSDKGINVPANKRQVGFLFQNYALWPNMTVYQNISFGLKYVKEVMPVYNFDVKNIDRILEILKKPSELLTILKESTDQNHEFDIKMATVRIIDNYEISEATTKRILSLKLHEVDSHQVVIEKAKESLSVEKEKILSDLLLKGFEVNEKYELIKIEKVKLLPEELTELDEEAEIVYDEEEVPHLVKRVAVIKKRRLTKEEIDLRVREVSRIVKIGIFMDRYPNELSGGQQQRVAIARTLAPKPKVLFMDEPLSNLDAKLRLEMRSELQRLHLDTHSTFIYVTHDQLEAMTLATEIALLDNGILQQYDKPLTIYEKPINLFVADFVGNPSINFIEAHGKFKDGKVELLFWDDIKATFEFNQKVDYASWLEEAALQKAHNQTVYVVDKANKDAPFPYEIHLKDEFLFQEAEELTDDDFVLAVRPEFINISDQGVLEGEIYSSMPTGMETTVKILYNNYIITGVVFGTIDYALGQKIKFDFDTKRILLFNRPNQQLIGIGKIDIVK